MQVQMRAARSAASAAQWFAVTSASACLFCLCSWLYGLCLALLGDALHGMQVQMGLARGAASGMACMRSTGTGIEMRTGLRSTKTRSTSTLRRTATSPSTSISAKKGSECGCRCHLRRERALPKQHFSIECEIAAVANLELHILVFNITA